MGVWTDAKEIARLVKQGGRVPNRSKVWHEQQVRIAAVPEDVGEALDALAPPWRDARDVAYGFSKIDQRRKLKLLREKLEARRAAQAEPPPPPKVVQRGPAKIAGLHIPSELAQVSRRVLRKMLEQALQTVAAGLRK